MLRRNINWVSYPSTTVLPKLVVRADLILGRAAAQYHVAAEICQNTLNRAVTSAVLHTVHRLIQTIEQNQIEK